VKDDDENTKRSKMGNSKSDLNEKNSLPTWRDLNSEVKAVCLIRDVSERLGWPYSRLTKKLSGFSALTEKDVILVREVITNFKKGN